ncbi:MAG: peptide chain release factor N(5)-glutamine methyltransferase [Bacteroidales bacterium]|nr:peptide chain release factor N(5)-glutamine methyltransferase [Bacteroidales bacterium]
MSAGKPRPTPTTWTIKALLQWTSEYFQTHKLESPRLEAQILLAHVMQCARIELVARSDEEPTPTERAQFKDLVRRRVEGWPVAYLVGQREFYLLAFEVSPAVLIPRPDTELLVLMALDRLKTKPNASVLDLGTGSGCIAISVAHQAKACHVTATDISPDALTIAQRNAAKHKVQDRLTFLNGDLFSALPPEARFDLILSNPPYITPGELATLAPDVRDHEPRVALDGGPDGLAFYRRIANEARAHLHPGGVVMVEIGWTQADAVRELFQAAGFTVGPTRLDQAKRPRVISAHG